jgi:hypothetical protein
MTGMHIFSYMTEQLSTFIKFSEVIISQMFVVLIGGRLLVAFWQ